MTGVFNATNEGVAWGELLAGADVTWVSDEYPASSTRSASGWSCRSGSPIRRGPGCTQTHVGRAVAEGLRFRPVAETIAGAAEAPAVDGVGLTPEREAELLEAWRKR